MTENIKTVILDPMKDRMKAIVNLSSAIVTLAETISRSNISVMVNATGNRLTIKDSIFNGNSGPAVTVANFHDKDPK